VLHDANMLVPDVQQQPADQDIGKGDNWLCYAPGIARGIAMPHVCTEYILVHTLFVPVCTWYMLYHCIVCTNAALCYTKYAQDLF
jgi:hypothetical protein